MPSCSVKNCKSGRSSMQISKVKLFSFPWRDADLCKVWVEFCQRDKINVKSARICSLHFDASQYAKKPMIQEMLNYSPKCQRKLKTNAVPTKPIVSYNILPQFIVQNQKVSPKNKSPWNVQEVYPGDLSNYNGQQIIITSPGFSVSDINPGNVEEVSDIQNNLVLNLNEGAKSSNQQSYGRPDNVIETELKESDINIKNNTCKRSLFNEHFNDVIPLPKSPEKEFTEQSDSFKNVLLSYHNDIEKYKKKIVELQTTINLQKEVIKMSPTNQMIEEEFERKFHEKLSGLFTSTQISLILRPKQKVYKWSETDIASAITLRSLSPKAYRYLREKLQYPLPGLSTLRKWAAKFDLKSGILHSILHIMKCKGESMSAEERITVLSFDETYLSKKICYDKSSQQIIGPHQSVQTVVARGVIGQWKQPVFYAYDTRMTKELLFEIIMTLTTCQFDVVAVVSDMGTSNQGLWKDLQITIDNSSFQHLSSLNKKIHVFADVPHLIKLARNHFVKKGFILPEQKYIGKQVVQEILNLNNDDHMLAYKITDDHINVPQRKIQSVKMAAQLFSNSLAQAISFCEQKNLLKCTNWKEASDVILLFNNWFDLMNTQQPVDKFVSSYGMDLTSQNKLLDDMNIFIKNMRVHGSTSMLPFQKGILITNQSLVNLFTDLQLNYPKIKYIMTRKLNHDVLENLFSYLKGMTGSNTHLSPLDFMHCLKRYVLGKHSNFVFSENRNTEDASEECIVDTECLTGITIKNSKIHNGSRDVQNNSSLELAMIDSDFGSCSVEIPKDQFNILLDFELQAKEKSVDDEAFEYVVGYVAKRFIGKYPQLGEIATPLTNNELNCSWTEYKSMGNLVKPTKLFFKVAKIMDMEFHKLHGNHVNHNPGIMQTLTDIVMDTVAGYSIEIPAEVVHCLVRTRTFMRINRLNKAIEHNQSKNLKDKAYLKKFIV